MARGITTAPHMDEAPFLPAPGILRRTGLASLSAGEGGAVVLLHGWGGFKEMWWGTMRALAPSHRTVALDWPGHGSVALERGRPVLDALAELTLDACAELGLEDVALVGHSFGGNVAVRAALLRPDLVSRLVLVDASIDAAYLSPTSRISAHPRAGRHLMRLNRVVGWPIGRLGARVPHEHGGGFVLPFVRGQHYLRRVEPDILVEYLRALRAGSLGERVREIVQPTLVVAGERDFLVHPEQARRLAEAIPHAHLHTLPRAYHCPMDESPAAFYRALLGFLGAHPPDGRPASALYSREQRA